MHDLPICWRVDAIDGGKDAVEPRKSRNPELIKESFDTEDEAVTRKAALKAAGMIACVIPVYSNAHARSKAHRAMQAVPLANLLKTGN